ncbi:MAG TPA: polyhydroxyalkanoic acid system family protein [Sphingomicrobium sp.]|nr:polyhydroxyalkanoic acid system family protein [Sphingomicrobium sp.]
MSQPIQVDLPHKLGKEEARRRIAGNVHKLKDHVPGGAAEVESHWSGDQLKLDVTAMGQRVETLIGVEDSVVRVRVLLPGLLGMFAKPIETMLQKKGDLLLEDKRD